MAHHRHRVDGTQALGAVGDVDRVIQVVHEHADDFAKAQSDNRQIVSAQLQGGRTQQNTKQTRQTRAYGYHRPQGRVQTIGEHGGYPREGVSQVRRSQQTKHISAHCKESDETQIKQTGVTDHNVQAQRQQHIQQRHVGDTHPGIAHRLQQQGQQQQGNRPQNIGRGFGLVHARSATLSPSKPEGRKVSMMMSTTNAKISA